MIFCFLSLLYICTYSDAISEVLSRRLAADREANISGSQEAVVSCLILTRNEKKETPAETSLPFPHVWLVGWY